MNKVRLLLLTCLLAAGVASSLAAVSPASAADGDQVRNGAGLCLTAGSAVAEFATQEVCQPGDAAQAWVGFGSGTFHLRNVQVNLCVDAFAHAPANGVPIEMNSCLNITNNNWSLRNESVQGNQAFLLVSGIAGSSSHCLSSSNPNQTGAVLELLQCSTAATELWTMSPSS
jgi:hypothetical protein